MNKERPRAANQSMQGSSLGSRKTKVKVVQSRYRDAANQSRINQTPRDTQKPGIRASTPDLPNVGADTSFDVSAITTASTSHIQGPQACTTIKKSKKQLFDYRKSRVPVSRQLSEEDDDGDEEIDILKGKLLQIQLVNKMHEMALKKTLKDVSEQISTLWEDASQDQLRLEQLSQRLLDANCLAEKSALIDQINNVQNITQEFELMKDKFERFSSMLERQQGWLHVSGISVPKSKEEFDSLRNLFENVNTAIDKIKSISAEYGSQNNTLAHTMKDLVEINSKIATCTQRCNKLIPRVHDQMLTEGSQEMSRLQISKPHIQ